MFSNIFDTIDDFVSDPIGTTVDVVTQPLVDSIDIIDGLTEGELRYKAMLRLGTDVAVGLSVSELVELYESE